MMDESHIEPLVKIRGRGTAWNPPNRFEPIDFVPDWDVLDPDEPGPRTQFLRDASKSIISRNDSPDIPFTASVNPYRGCEHGCICLLPKASREHICVTGAVTAGGPRVPSA
jgi:hypothetical protein